MHPLTAPQVRASFVNCSQRRAKSVSLPAAFDETDWASLDYLGWRDPKAPQQAYVVLERDERTLGILLRTHGGTVIGARSGLCNVCFSAHRSSDVTLFAAPRAGAAGKHGNTVGTYLCADLGCSLYARGLRRLSLPQGETMGVEERVERLRGRLHAFVDKVLEG